MIYHKDVESFSVTEATKDRDRLSELNIRSPDLDKMYKLKVDRQTMFYFRNKNQRAKLIEKYYNRRTKKYSFENTQTNEEL